jgi:hypothetical protein
MCEHRACAECMLAGDEKAGLVCCKCGKKKRHPENSLNTSEAEASTNNQENHAAEKLNESLTS